MNDLMDNRWVEAALELRDKVAELRDKVAELRDAQPGPALQTDFWVRVQELLEDLA